MVLQIKLIKTSRDIVKSEIANKLEWKSEVITGMELSERCTLRVE
jgi:hypothetical protein